MWTFAADRSRTRSLQLLLLALTLPGVLVAGLDPADLDAPVAADGAWLSEVERRISRAEYEITWQTATPLDDLAASWHAPNRAQGFRTYFTEAGIRVVPRTAEKPSWEWSLKLSGWGRPGAVQAAGSALLRPEGNRIDYDRGRLVEWYFNKTRGLEQGFTLSGPPAGDAQDAVELADSSEVWIELTLGGTLRPVVSTDGQAIDFATPGGAPAIHYAHLAVADATGRLLPARMEGFPGGIRLVFEDEDAVYPVTVDPLATAAAWTAESDQPDGLFGVSVATAGDVNGDGYSDVIIAASSYDNGETDEGRAYVYLGSAAGLSAVEAWTAESDQADAHFGLSVATAGDVNGDGYSDVIVGADRYDNGETNEGRAYVYLGSAAGLSTVEAWTAESDQAEAQFGFSVVTAGDVNGDGYSDVIVGASGYDNGETNEGRAYVYLGSAAGLSTVEAWTAESDQADALFGWSVATTGDVNGDGYSDVIVGAWAYDNPEMNEGRAYVYLGSAAGLSTVEAWTLESDETNASFGISVATAGDVDGDGYSDVIVGASSYSNGVTYEGRAFVYLGSATGLSTVEAWTAESDQEHARFGRSVATAGDVNGDGYSDVIVGAHQYDNGEANEGRAYVYLGSAAGLSTVEAWTVESDQADAQFGFSAVTAGDVNGDGYSDVIVGAFRHDNGETDEGRAYVYLGFSSGLSAVEAWTAESDQAGAAEWFGLSAATAGDVNGDGYSDVIVGARRYDNGEPNEGRAYVYLGSAAGLSSVEAWAAESDKANAEFGYSVATAGDVNGDGYSDVIVGTPAYTNGEGAEGRTFVYHGSAAGLSALEAWTAESNQSGATFGRSVSTAGDVNGDGYSDVIVGADLCDNGETNEGRAYVYLGSAAGLSTVEAWTAESDQADAWFGNSVATAGDVNGDGYSDVIVGAHVYTNGETREGRAYVYHGSAEGLSSVEAWTAEGDRATAYFGGSVATAGDVNGDGYSDVIVGAYFYNNGEFAEGRAYVYHGSAAGLSSVEAWTAENDQLGAEFGVSVATAGDVNGDGYSDVIVGAIFHDNGETDEGRAYVYLGSAAGLSTVEAWSAESDQAEAAFGNSVATAGDVNGDGYSDVIVGASGYDNGEAEEGRAYVYYGNDGAGLSLRPQQRRVDDTGPIDHGCLSDSPTGFGLALLGRSPFGRGRVKLEWEVKPLGETLNGIDTQTAVHWSDSNTAGAALSQRVADLVDDTLYHWRVRMRYDPVTTPFQGRSRWLTVPRGGWQEAMLRTLDLTAAGSVDALVMDEAGGVQITLSWGASCLVTDMDYAIYEGTLGQFTSHTSRYCSTAGATTKTFTPLAGDTYYLVVPLSAAREGSYGTNSGGSERFVGDDACLPQQIGNCE